MSYDIRLTDRVTGETLEATAPHQIRGGTYAVGGTTELWLNVTYNYAPCSETKGHISVRNSFARRTRLLIASGLIAGITPTSIARRSPQRTLDFAFSKPAGGDAGERRAGSS